MLSQRSMRRLERVVARGWTVEIDQLTNGSWRLVATSERYDTTAVLAGPSMHAVVRHTLHLSLEY